MITELAGKRIFPVGFGTWGMGGWALNSDSSNDANEIKAIKFAIGHNINVIDTAEMYGRGHAEELIAQAIKGKEREDLFIISKVSPANLTYEKVMRAAEASLKRLNTKYIDLYLIHWPTPLMDMRAVISAMEDLIDKGMIRSMGVSNFGVNDIRKALEHSKRYEITANQISYSLAKMDPEDDIIPFCAKNKIKIIAYTPLGKGKVTKMKEAIDVANKYKKTPIQVALNYLMKKSLPIPKATNIEHIKEILGSVGWGLDEKDYKMLSQIR
jgi:diketogulonate reductase-like aldo/keto reductase